MCIFSLSLRIVFLTSDHTFDLSSLMLQLNQELENDDLHYLPLLGSPMANSPPSESINYMLLFKQNRNFNTLL